MILKKHLPLTVKHFAFISLAILPTIVVAQQNVQHTHTPKLGGVGSFNYSWDDTGINKVNNARKYGDWRFHTLRLHVDGNVDGVHYFVEHGWFRNRLSNMVSRNDSGTYNHFLEAYASHTFDNGVVGQVGNTRVPFSNLDSFSFWHNIPFYAGLGENYQTGLKMVYCNCPWNVQLQLGKNSLVSSSNATSYTPKLTTGYYSTNTASSSVNMPHAGWYAKNNEDSVQLTGRVVRMHSFNDHSKVEVGLSARLGNTYNTKSTLRGKQWAAALHVNACMHNWLVQVQYVPYKYSPKYGTGVDTGVGADVVKDTVQLGKDGVLYTIPTKANILVAGVGYNIPTSWWDKVKQVTVYNDYSVLSGKATKKTTKMNILGFKFNAGPLFVTAEAITAKNMVGIGQGKIADTSSPNIFNIGGDGYTNYNDTAGVFANSAYDDSVTHWKTKFNVNLAVKF